MIKVPSTKYNASLAARLNLHKVDKLDNIQMLLFTLLRSKVSIELSKFKGKVPNILKTGSRTTKGGHVLKFNRKPFQFYRQKIPTVLSPDLLLPCSIYQPLVTSMEFKYRKRDM